MKTSSQVLREWMNTVRIPLNEQDAESLFNQYQTEYGYRVLPVNLYPEKVQDAISILKTLGFHLDSSGAGKPEWQLYKSDSMVVLLRNWYYSSGTEEKQDSTFSVFANTDSERFEFEKAMIAGGVTPDSITLKAREKDAVEARKNFKVGDKVFIGSGTNAQPCFIVKFLKKSKYVFSDTCVVRTRSGDTKEVPLTSLFHMKISDGIRRI